MEHGFRSKPKRDHRLVHRIGKKSRILTLFKLQQPDHAINTIVHGGSSHFRSLCGDV
jgi:hypothetical protein